LNLPKPGYDAGRLFPTTRNKGLSIGSKNRIQKFFMTWETGLQRTGSSIPQLDHITGANRQHSLLAEWF
jgi:hypothetical protein